MSQRDKRNPEIIWSQKSVLKTDILKPVLVTSVFFAIIAIIFYLIDFGFFILILIWGIPSIFLQVKLVSPRTYVLTEKKLSSKVSKRITEWSLRLEDIMKTDVTYSSKDMEEDAGTVVVHALSKPRLLEGVLSPREVADKIRFHSRRRKEELGISGDVPVLPSDSKAEFESTPNGWKFSIPIDDTIGLLLIGLAFCLTAALVGFIHIFATTGEKGPYITVLIAGTALFAVIAWVQGFRSKPRKLELAIKYNNLETRQVPFMFIPKRKYDLYKIRNARGYSNTGTFISAAEVVERYESSSEEPFFPELNKLPSDKAYLVFEYENRTVIVGEEASMTAGEIVFLLCQIGRAMSRSYESEGPAGFHSIRVSHNGDETMIEAGPRRSSRHLAGFSAAVFFGAGFSILFLWMYYTALITGYEGNAVYYTAVASVVCAIFTVISGWALILELFNSQVIIISPSGVSRKGSIWPLNKRAEIGIDWIETVALDESGIYLGHSENSASRTRSEFIIGRVEKGDLLRIADLLKQKYSSIIKYPDLVEEQIKRSDKID